MRLATEAEIVQNTALGATLLWNFSVEYFSTFKKERGPLLPYSLPILPMVLHRETTDEIFNRRFDGGLDLALAQNRTLTIDLQERMEAMAHRTLAALNVAFASQLLGYARERGELIPLRMSVPTSVDSEEIRKMQNAARRLGYWFATINTVQLCNLLRIRL